jgi:hypothetical protein
MEAHDRRWFLVRLMLLAGSTISLVRPALLSSALAPKMQRRDASDEDLFHDVINKHSGPSILSKPIGELIADLGISFLGTPYVAHSLENPGKEQLVVNLRAFDCTTFVENMFVIARCIKLGTASFDDFKKQLQFVRYRSGIIKEYPSRLHYFTDWVGDNQQKGTLADVTRKIGGVPYRKVINFMTTHTASYRQLFEKTYVDEMRVVEDKLNAADHFYIPKDRVAEVEADIHSGDFIGIATAVEGIDVSHIGLAVEKGGTIRFLHAPLSGGAVELSPGSLAAYLASHNKQTGIMVARAQEPRP